MDYDRQLDEYIIQILEQGGGNKRYFNELLRLINDRHYTKAKPSKRTLTNHLDVMENQKIIERDPDSKRYKRYVWLHRNTIIQRKYHFFNGVEGVKTTGSKEQKSNERNKKLVLFLILFFGYGRDKVKLTPRTRPRTSGVYSADPVLRNFDILNYKEPGLSALDLKSNAKGSSPIQTLLAFNKFNEDEVQDMFKEITEYQEIPLRKYLTSDNQEIGYYIEDEILQSFLYWCLEILVDLIRRMEKEYYFLLKKPKEDELSWLFFVCGKDYVTYLFTEIEDNRAKKKSIKELCVKYFYHDWSDDPDRIDRHVKMIEKTFPDEHTKHGIEKKLKIYDNKIKQEFKYLDSNKNKEYVLQIKIRYSWMLESIKNIICPRFLARRYSSSFLDN